MGESLTVDESLVQRLPLPLAKLYLRAHNTKKRLDRHQTAYYLWEATIRLLASAAVATYAERPGHDPDLEEPLRKLARPSLGDWWGLTRQLIPILADSGDEGYAAIRELIFGRAKDDLPHIAELDALLKETLGQSTGSGRRLHLNDLLDRLVRYRNRELGHGAVGRRPDEFHARMGQALLTGVSELLARLDVLAGRRLVFIEEVRLQKSGHYLIEWYKLTGESAKRIESLEQLASQAASLPKPEQVYLDGWGQSPDQPASSTSYPLIPLRPLLVYDPRIDEVLFLNSRSKGQRCNYLCFTTGEHQELDELEGEQLGLVSRLLGQPVDLADSDRSSDFVTEDEELIGRGDGSELFGIDVGKPLLESDLKHRRLSISWFRSILSQPLSQFLAALAGCLVLLLILTALGLNAAKKAGTTNLPPPVYRCECDVYVTERGGEKRADRPVLGGIFDFLQRDDYVYLVAKLLDQKTAYFYILQIDSRGHANALFPKEWGPGRLPSNESERADLRIPPVGEMPLDPEAPPGLEALICFVRPVPLTAEHNDLLWDLCAGKDFAWEQPKTFKKVFVSFVNGQYTQHRGFDPTRARVGKDPVSQAERDSSHARGSWSGGPLPGNVLSVGGPQCRGCENRKGPAMRRNVRYGATAIAVWVCVGLGSWAGAQDAAKRFLERMEAKANDVEAWERRELKRLSQEAQGHADELRELVVPVQGLVLANNNAYREAEKKWLEAIAKYERLPERERTPVRNLLQVEALLELGRLYAVMGERERGRAVIHKAAVALARLDERDGGEPLRIRGGAEVGIVLHSLERPREAVSYVNEALARCERYTVRQKTPDRLALLAMCQLAKAVVALANGDPKAEALAQEALKVLRPVGNPSEKAQRPVDNPREVAAALGVLGAARVDRGEGGDALKSLQEADQLMERAFPQGNPARAALALILADSYQQLGQGEQALEQVGRSRLMWEQLFPKKDFANGHPALILALMSLGDALEKLGRKDLALPLHHQAWDLSRAYYPGDHEIKLVALLSYGHSLYVSRTPRDSPATYLDKFQEAVAMGEHLYGWAGHPNLARSRVLLGTALADFGRARANEAFAQFKAADFYYRTRYPAGHPQAAVLAQLQGDLYGRLGDRARAAALFREALEIDQGVLRKSTRNVADAEAFALGRQRQASYHGYLSASRDLPAAEQGRAYVGAWHAKGAVTRLLAERRAVRRLRLGQMEPGANDGLLSGQATELSRMWEELLDSDAQFGRLLLDDREEPAVRDQAIATLEAHHAELQRELARRAPTFRRQQDMGRLGPDALARVLPVGSAFVDIIRYEDILAGAAAAPRYAAFVITPGADPLRAELGPAVPIEDAVQKWRDAVIQWDPRRTSKQRSDLEAVSDAEGVNLRRLVWEPIAAHLPPGTTRLFLAPEGALAGLPFAALPGPKAHTALLDEYVFARVPHGPFLLESLERQAPPSPRKGPFLALGGVVYDPPYRSLPGSVEAVHLAEQVTGSRPTITLQQRQATPGALCKALPQAGDALIETHAFYREDLQAAEEERRLAFIRDWPPSGGLSAPRGLAPVARSPLFYTGLILAPDGRVPGESGELSGGLIAELSLGGLRSAFLPDCDTGVGEYLPAEGVQSLQEAFHLAGCPNVIASLWPVPDAPTRALVSGYYDQLWGGERSPSSPEALCLAQRELYHNPRKAGVPADASDRYPERSHPLLWAGLVHSGIGR